MTPPSKYYQHTLRYINVGIAERIREEAIRKNTSFTSEVTSSLIKGCLLLQIYHLPEPPKDYRKHITAGVWDDRIMQYIKRYQSYQAKTTNKRMLIQDLTNSILYLYVTNLDAKWKLSRRGNLLNDVPKIEPLEIEGKQYYKPFKKIL